MKKIDVLVIGGGVIGVCAAYYLAQAGRKVTLVEKGEICSGCSYGNAGLVSPSHAIPLAAPGVWQKGLKWMFDPESPFYIKPRLNLDLLRWLWRFQRSCTKSRARTSLPVLGSLMRASVDLFRELARLPGLEFGFRQEGLLMLFRTGRGFEEGLKEAEWVRGVGIESTAMTPSQVREKAAHALASLAGGIYYPGDAHLQPADFVGSLARAAASQGACLCPSTEVLAMETSGRIISNVKTTRGDYSPDQVVLAGGAWSPLVSRDLDIRLPIQAAKGYSLTFRRPDGCPSFPILFAETKVIATPMGGTLRLAGTLELTGLDLSINTRRVKVVRRAAYSYVSGLENLELIEIWRGLRPCTPDGLPIVGPHSGYENLIVASGHAMLGITLGPITGKLVSQLITGEEPMVDVSALRCERFP